MNQKKLLNAVIVGLVKTRIVTSAIESSISCLQFLSKASIPVVLYYTSK
jgi:hypothetical protein